MHDVLCLRSRRACWAAVSLLLLGLGSCRSPSEWVGEADREVDEVLTESTFRVLDARESHLLQPEPAVEIEQEAVEPGTQHAGQALATMEKDRVESEAADRSGVEGRPTRIDLASALISAFTTSREFVSRRESLYLQGLSLSLTRFNFGPQLNATLSTLFTDARGGTPSTTTSGSFGVSQILPTGGTFALSSGLSFLRSPTPSARDVYTSNLNFSLNQPLLRGAGYEVSHEALTQAERNMVYEVRSFELFRQDHAISIASDYFDLVSERTQLLNEERRYAEAVFDREKAEALRQLDRNQDEDVFLARRNEINAENGVLVARANYDLQVDSFRIRLGLPDDQEIDVGDEEPPFLGVSLDPDSAVTVALGNRLDLITAKERLEDSARSLRLSRDTLLPDLDLTMGYGLSGVHNSKTGSVSKFDKTDPTDDVQNFEPNGQLLSDRNSSVGLSLDIPIQRKSERNAYRSAVIARDRSQRDYDILLENVERDINDALRQLERTEQQIDLQVEQIGQEERAVAVTEIRYEAGDVENRALLEARAALINAENALISFKVSHFVSRLRLYRDLGLLFIENDGMWRL